MRSAGIVYLVGAGPGHPDLITVRGLRCLRQADVVAYDRLIHPDLLAEAPAAARLIDVGKTPGQKRTRQTDINALLIQAARAGHVVIRLKGGDPFVFGRGGEECQALAAAGVRYEVVPGVSSAIAAPAFAGIPVTQRHLARSFTVVTGHTAGSDTADLDWATLAKLDTLVFLMGVRNLPRITQELQAHGRSGHTPAALIRCGGTDLQETVTGTLATIAAAARGVRPPATLVIGEVAGLHREIGWFAPEPAATAVFPAAVNTLSPLLEVSVP